MSELVTGTAQYPIPEPRDLEQDARNRYTYHIINLSNYISEIHIWDEMFLTEENIECKLDSTFIISAQKLFNGKILPVSIRH